MSSTGGNKVVGSNSNSNARRQGTSGSAQITKNPSAMHLGAKGILNY